MQKPDPPGVQIEQLRNLPQGGVESLLENDRAVQRFGDAVENGKISVASLEFLCV
jgi:hypothetical protein